MVRFYVKDQNRKPDPEPVKVNAHRALAVGTGIWAAVLLFALFTASEDSKETNLIATCIVGIVLGILGYWHTRRTGL